MNRIIGFIPHLFTLGNLLCGCLAIKFAFEWDLVTAALLVGIAAVLDFFDGFLARLLKVSGELGKQLDSLADVVSFGVVPGVVMFQMMRVVSFEVELGNEMNIWVATNISSSTEDMNNFISPWCYLAFVIPLLSAYRLAKFNIDIKQSDKFIGLPTPANAIFICSLGLIFCQFIGYYLPETISWLRTYPVISNSFNLDTAGFTLYDFHLPQSSSEESGEIILAEIISRTNLFILLICITLIFSLLLVSNLSLFALKFKNFSWADNKIRYIFVLISVALLIFLHVVAIPFIILLYIVLSVLNNYIFKL